MKKSAWDSSQYSVFTSGTPFGTLPGYFTTHGAVSVLFQYRDTSTALTPTGGCYMLLLERRDQQEDPEGGERGKEENDHTTIAESCCAALSSANGLVAHVMFTMLGFCPK